MIVVRNLSNQLTNYKSYHMKLKKVLQFICFVFLLIGSINALSQERKVTGKVTDQKTGKPLANVSVRVKNGTQSTITNETGYFTIKVPSSESVISVSHVGYGIYEQKIGKTTLLEIVLAEVVTDLNDVVVIGYGTQKKGDVLGAVNTFKPSQVEDIPQANFSTSLMNTLPGVSVAQTAGKPGATTNLVVRNAVVWGSIGSNSPLYIIDGIAPSIATSGSIDATGKAAFDMLDPSQIESVTFLKDAVATIYGARGAYGVVIVTTKKGKAGKPRITYSGSYSTADASKKVSMLSGYDQALLLNNWVQNFPAKPVVGTEIYTADELSYLKTQNNSWVNQAWSVGSTQKHAITISGGTDKITFFAGGNYYDQIGNIQNVESKRYGYRFGMTARIISGLSAEVILSGNNAIDQRLGVKGTATSEQSDQMNATYGGLLEVPAWVPSYVGGKPVYYSPLGWNPLALVSSGSYSRNSTNSSDINLSLEYKVPSIQGLSFKVQFVNDSYNSFGKEWDASYNAYNPVIAGVHTNFASGTNKATGTQNVMYSDSLGSTITTVKNGNQLTESSNTSKNWQSTESVSYHTSIHGGHELGLILLAEQSQVKGDYLQTNVQTQIIPGYDQIFAFSTDPTNWSITGNSLSGGRVSFMGRLNYSYLGKYLLESSFRDDASPNFPDNHRWGLFGSGGVGWKISEENFFKNNVKFINDLKLRFNYGLTGNDQTSGAFTWVTRYTASSYGYLFGSNLTNGLQYSTIPNPQISWEKSIKKDLGLDGTFANRKFSFGIDGWASHDYDKLETPSPTVPNTFGANKFADVNHGILNQWGIEGMLGYNANIGNKGFSVFANINFGWSDNKIIQKFYNVNSDTGYLNPIGKRSDLGITGYKATGIVRTQTDVTNWYAQHAGWTINSDSLRAGDLNYQDLDGDGKITSNDVTQIAKRSSNIFGMGFTFGAAYKGFRLSCNIALGIGGKIAWKKVDITPPTKDVNGLAMWKDSYTATNTNASLPAIYAPLVNQTSTFWLHSGTKMTVNNMQLSYTLPQSVVTKNKLPDCRIYITGFNLWNIINPTPFRDSRSSEITDYPILRTWTFGLNIGL